uniref:FGFR1 onco partner 2 n=1 Tax=Ictidomys tridecemlineatus TaxID=43179 RepID=I3MBZ0_ICTTR
MSCTIEKALADAKALVERLRDHDDAAESLIEQTTALNKRVEAMKQSALELIMSKYREQMFRLLMIDMVHRNNSEGFFLDASRHVLEAPQHGLERRHLEANQNELQAHVDQITEMAAVMRKAIEIDEQQGCKEQERIFQLEQENKGLREILQITRESFLNLRKDDASESTSLSALVTNSDLSLRKS